MSTMLRVRINSPDKLVWEGEAEWVSSANTAGTFDILPFHANFITFVEGKPIRINSGGKVKEYTFEHSVIYAHGNTVSIYANM